MVMLSARDALLCTLSVTVTPIAAGPGVVGVPEIVLPLRLSPAGKVVALHV